MKHLFANKKTKVLLWTLAGVFVVGVIVFIYAASSGKLAGQASTATTFSDVPTTYWAYNEITASAMAGFAQGYTDGTFRPTQPVTRDQAAVFIARAVAGGDVWVPNGPAVAHCSDVPTTQWAYKYVEYLISQKVIGSDCGIAGTNATPKVYKPAQVLIRQEMAVLLARGMVGEANVSSGPTTPTFSDVATSNPAYKYIEYLAKLAIAQGYAGGTYRPGQSITRDQIAVFIARAFDLDDVLNGIID